MVEFFFVLYLLSGSLKGILYAFSIHPAIDVTLLTAALLISSILVNHFIFRNKINFNKAFSRENLLKLLPFILFYAWCTITLLYDRTGYPNYVEDGSAFSIKKLFYFLTCVVAIVAAMLHSKFDFLKFSKFFIGFTVIISLFYVLITPASYGLYFPDLVIAHRVLEIYQPSFLQAYFPSLYEYINFDFSQVLSEHLTLAELLGISLFLSFQFKNSLSKYLLISLMLFLLLSANGRGPVLIFLFCYPLYILIKSYRRSPEKKWSAVFAGLKLRIKTSLQNLNRRRALIVIGFNIFLLGIILSNPIISKLYQKSLNRYIGIIGYSIGNDEEEFMNSFFKHRKRRVDASILGRELYIKNSFRLISANAKRFFGGYGFGNFAKASGFALMVNDHPHNVILEVFVETGLVGTLLFGWFLYMVYRSCRSGNLIIAMCVLYVFMNSLKSVPLVDRTTFAFYSLILFAAISRNDKKKHELNISGLQDRAVN